jgi:hypothetical protein
MVKHKGGYAVYIKNSEKEGFVLRFIAKNKLQAKKMLRDGILTDLSTGYNVLDYKIVPIKARSWLEYWKSKR